LSAAAITPPPATPAERSRAVELLSDPPFRRYFFAQSISVLGDQVSALAIPLIAVLVDQAGPMQMGLLTAAVWLPSLLFSLYAGAWVDRRRQRRAVMIVADLVRFLLIASIPLGYALGLLDLWQLYLVAFLTGTVATFFDVANATVFVSLVPQRRFLQANTLLHGSRAVAYVAGPSLAGLLIQLLAAPVAVLVDAASFLASAMFLVRAPAVEPAAQPRGRGQATAGVRILAASRSLRALLLGVTTINLFTFMFSALFILYVTRSLHVRPGLLGAILAAGSVGTLLGAAITGKVSRWIGIGPAFILGCLIFPAPLLLVPAAAGSGLTVAAVLFAAEFVSGLGVMMLDITAGSIQAAVIPAAVRARVSGVNRTINYGARPVGALLGGVLGGWLGPRTALWIAAAGGVCGVLWLLPSPLPRMRELPAQAAEPDEPTRAPEPDVPHLPNVPPPPDVPRQPAGSMTAPERT
jgi:MFS family permease